MIPRLFAFDLDGTLLNSKKQISTANLAALKEISDSGAIVAFASGRLGSSMLQYSIEELDLPMLTLNGAAVYLGKNRNCRLIYQASLSSEYADFLISYSQDRNFGLNYYIDDNLYTVKTEKTTQWVNLYIQQTSTVYNFIESFDSLKGQTPSKILFVGEPSEIDRQEIYFRKLWQDSIYICRTWDHYLEFLNPDANKGTGLRVLADAYGIDMTETAAFGDGINDIPMLQAAGIGVTLKNALEEVKVSAKRVSPWTNDEDAIAREWNLMKRY